LLHACRKENVMEIRRREFLGFFLVGGLLSALIRKLWPQDRQQPKVALFWRRKA
jgi:hypothetical protein